MELGRKEALESVENRTCEALNQFISKSERLEAQMHESLEKIKKEAVKLAVSSALKLSGDVLQALPNLSLESILQEVLLEFFGLLSNIHALFPKHLLYLYNVSFAHHHF